MNEARIFSEEVEPLLDRLRAICAENGLALHGLVMGQGDQEGEDQLGFSVGHTPEGHPQKCLFRALGSLPKGGSVARLALLHYILFHLPDTEYTALDHLPLFRDETGGRG